MKTDVISALIYLCKHHASNECKLTIDFADVSEILKKAGFNEEVARSTDIWLALLMEDKGGLCGTPEMSSLRVFSKKEHFILGTEAWEFLLRLEKQGILDAVSREIVLSQAGMLPVELISLGLFKWIILLVLSNHVSVKEGLKYLDFIALEKEILREVYK